MKTWVYLNLLLTGCGLLTLPTKQTPAPVAPAVTEAPPPSAAPAAESPELVAAAEPQAGPDEIETEPVVHDPVQVSAAVEPAPVVARAAGRWVTRSEPVYGPRGRYLGHRNVTRWER